MAKLTFQDKLLHASTVLCDIANQEGGTTDRKLEPDKVYSLLLQEVSKSEETFRSEALSKLSNIEKKVLDIK